MSQIDQKKIARVFKIIRVKNHLTQEELSKKLYCDVRQVRRYETEGTDRLTVVNLYAELFNIDSLSILSMSQDAFFLYRTFLSLTLIFYLTYNIGVSKRYLKF